MEKKRRARLLGGDIVRKQKPLFSVDGSHLYTMTVDSVQSHRIRAPSKNPTFADKTKATTVALTELGWETLGFAVSLCSEFEFIRRNAPRKIATLLLDEEHQEVLIAKTTWQYIFLLSRNSMAWNELQIQTFAHPIFDKEALNSKIAEKLEGQLIPLGDCARISFPFGKFEFQFLFTTGFLLDEVYLGLLNKEKGVTGFYKLKVKDIILQEELLSAPEVLESPQFLCNGICAAISVAGFRLAAIVGGIYDEGPNFVKIFDLDVPNRVEGIDVWMPKDVNSYFMSIGISEDGVIGLVTSLGRTIFRSNLNDTFSSPEGLNDNYTKKRAKRPILNGSVAIHHWHDHGCSGTAFMDEDFLVIGEKGELLAWNYDSFIGTVTRKPQKKVAALGTPGLTLTVLDSSYASLMPHFYEKNRTLVAVGLADGRVEVVDTAAGLAPPLLSVAGGLTPCEPPNVVFNKAWLSWRNVCALNTHKRRDILTRFQRDVLSVDDFKIELVLDESKDDLFLANTIVIEKKARIEHLDSGIVRSISGEKTFKYRNPHKQWSRQEGKDWSGFWKCTQMSFNPDCTLACLVDSQRIESGLNSERRLLKFLRRDLGTESFKEIMVVPIESSFPAAEKNKIFVKFWKIFDKESFLVALKDHVLIFLWKEEILEFEKLEVGYLSLYKSRVINNITVSENKVAIAQENRIFVWRCELFEKFVLEEGDFAMFKNMDRAKMPLTRRIDIEHLALVNGRFLAAASDLNLTIWDLEDVLKFQPKKVLNLTEDFVHKKKVIVHIEAYRETLLFITATSNQKVCIINLFKIDLKEDFKIEELKSSLSVENKTFVKGWKIIKDSLYVALRDLRIAELPLE